MLESETEGLNDLFREGQNEGPRSTAILLAANLDNRLYSILESFVCVEPKEAEKLLKGAHAPLGTFSSKIRACFFLGLITDDEAHDLNRIRDIRNLFAHREHGLTFESKEVVSHCKAMRLPIKIESAGSMSGIDLTNNLFSFRFTAATLTVRLAERVAEAKRQRRTKPGEMVFTKAPS